MIPEINTAGLRRDEAEAYPAWEILERYRALGGELVSIGSDAHRSVDIGHGFPEVAERLRAIGFVRRGGIPRTRTARHPLVAGGEAVNLRWSADAGALPRRRELPYTVAIQGA